MDNLGGVGEGVINEAFDAVELASDQLYDETVEAFAGSHYAVVSAYKDRFRRVPRSMSEVPADHLRELVRVREVDRQQTPSPRGARMSKLDATEETS